MDIQTLTIRELLNYLVKANEAYRNGRPTLTDASYDEAEDRLAELVSVGDGDLVEVQDGKAYLASIGAPPADNSGWLKVRHSAPMTSLNKAQSVADLRDWHAGCGGLSGFVVSMKCDGISCSLAYIDGNLVRALTRGDGDVGEDITRNVVRMKGVVHGIKGFTGHLRGEVVLLKSDHLKHFPNHSNPRNAAAGIAKRLDGQGSEHLTVLHYQMIREGGAQALMRKSHEFTLLERVGCAVPAWHSVQTLAETEAIYAEYVASKRAALDFEIDGLVVEHDNLATMEALGDQNHRPKGGIALKFPHARKQSILRGVRWQVGKSGRITPVAEFDTVDLAGAQVSNATLHNLTNIARLASSVGRPHLCVGDLIVVSRRNDVIPQIEEILSGNSSGAALKAPDNCPACGTGLLMDGEYLVCHGEDCPAQVLGGISRWCKKTGVLGLGDSIIEALIEYGGVADPADLYTIDPKKAESIPVGSDGSRLGRSAYVIVDELKEKSELPLFTIIGSLGIPMCARSMCKKIVEAGYDTLPKMQAATFAEIAAVPGLGDTKADAFVKGLAARKTLIEKLMANGVRVKAVSVGVLTGKSVCMTGFRNPELSKAVEDAGGTVKDSVGKGLTYLVQKTASSSSTKTVKAQSLGVLVIGIDDMWKILGGGNPPPKAPPKPSALSPAPLKAVVSTAGGLFDLFEDD